MCRGFRVYRRPGRVSGPESGTAVPPDWRNPGLTWAFHLRLAHLVGISDPHE